MRLRPRTGYSGVSVRCGFQLPTNWVRRFTTASTSFAATWNGMSTAHRRELSVERSQCLSGVSGNY